MFADKNLNTFLSVNGGDQQEMTTMTPGEYALFTASTSSESKDGSENTTINELENSSSCEDLNFEGKRIMRDRSQEEDRVKTLGNLVPIDTEESTGDPIPPRPLRRKRAETLVNYSDEEGDMEPQESDNMMTEKRPSSNFRLEEQSVGRKKKSILQILYAMVKGNRHNT